MSIETQRSILQLISGTCWVIFGVVLLYRSLRKHGIVWPLRWHMLSSLALMAAGITQMVHGAVWLDGTATELHDWPWLLPLWAQMIFTVWAFYRWVKDPEERR